MGMRSVLPAALLLTLIIVSCEKQESDREDISGQGSFSPAAIQNTSEILFTQNFIITSPKEGLVTSILLENTSFSGYENFMITVQNGDAGRTKVTRIDISLENVIITHKNFKKNINSITMPVRELTSSSVLNVRLEGTAGRFVIVTITASLKASTVADIDGNIYKTIKIGDQWWMAENLKTTRLNDGTAIPLIEQNSEWLITAANHLPALSWYDNDTGNKNTYGALYNWAAAGNNRLCPAGWHVPDESEVFELSFFIDPESENGYYSSISGGALKENGTEHWNSPNTGATDEYGFTARPGGTRNVEGNFINLGTAGSWWSDDGLASYNMLYDDASLLFSEGGNEYGRSVRCVKD